MQASEQKLQMIQMLLLLNNQKYLKQIETLLIEAIQMEKSFPLENENELTDWDIGSNYDSFIPKKNFKEWIQSCEEGNLLSKEVFITEFLQWKKCLNLDSLD